MQDNIFNKEDNSAVRCPYFKQGIRQNLCLAYIYGLMVPSMGQEDTFCNGLSYAVCPTYLLRIEDIKEKEVVDVGLRQDKNYFSIIYLKDGDSIETCKFIQI